MKTPRPLTPVPILALPALALLLTGCAGDGTAPGTDVTRTSTPGGWDRVEYGELPPGQVTELGVDLEIGSLDGADGGFFFGDVRGIELTPGEDTLLVLDYQASEIHAFDLEGAHLGVRHGPGEGPGEVSEANGMLFDREGALWINDHGRMRMSRILPTGEVETFPFPLGRYGYLWRGTVGPEGRLWHDIPFRDTDPVRPEPGYHEATAGYGVLAVDPRSGARDSVRIGTSVTRGIALERGFAGAPYAPARLLAFDPAGAAWTMESSDRYRLTRIELATGDTTVQVELPIRGPGVTAEERDAEVERVEAFMERAGRVTVDWDEVIPDRKPVAYQLSVDGRGNVWVLRQRAGDGRWATDVITPDGTYRHTYLLPFEPSRYYIPVIRDGWYFTVRAGEYDEQYVVGARIEEG